MSKNAKVLQLVLGAIILLLAVRLFLTIRERQTKFVIPERQESALDPDFYVSPKKLHPLDLKGARELTRQPVWVREGYRFVYYPVRPPVDFSREAGKLGPIEKLSITDVIVQRAPGSPARQVMAVFQKDGKSYAFPIGTEEGGNYQIFSDDLLFIQDPHELYKHWSPEVWKAIEAHEVKPGMNEIQASFSVGVGLLEGSGTGSTRTLNYPNNGHPLRVTYTDGKATEIRPGV